MKDITHNIVGLIPAAGRATRISPLPVSKELFPVGFHETDEKSHPKVAAHYLLEQMINAGINRCFIVLGEGKWDIPGYFGNGEQIGINLAYSVIRQSQGTPFTLDAVHAFIEDRIVALGFPDMLFENPDIYQRLIRHYQPTECDVLLGLFPTDQPHLADMVEFDSEGNVNKIIIKPANTDLQFTWGVALWSPAFTAFMHDWLSSIDASNLQQVGAKHRHGELFVGDAIQAALEAGMKVDAIQVSEHPFLDIGNLTNLRHAIHKHAAHANKNPD